MSPSASAPILVNADQEYFRPGALWPDDHGVHINAHGGGILFHQGRYYWYGEHKIAGPAGNQAQVGVRCYSSTDLYHWRNEGIALSVSDDPASDIARGCILERPKVVRRRTDGRFVMWFHLERLGEGYSSARVGVAVADAPIGPFRFVHSLRPNAGHWPLNVTAEQRDALANESLMAEMRAKQFRYDNNPETGQYPLIARDFAAGQESRDMTLFVDEDGEIYHVCAAEMNSTLHISRLTEDCLRTSGEYVRVFACRWHEAPALCKHQGRYWMISSDCTGWAPNAARSAVADSIFGPWTELGNPMRGPGPAGGPGPELTFGGQSTFLLPVAGQPETVIAMFDQWRPDNPIDGQYLWLPVRFTPEQIEVVWSDCWRLE